MSLIEIGKSYDDAVEEERVMSQPIPKGDYDVKILEVLLDKGQLFTSQRTGTHNFKLLIGIAVPEVPALDGKRIKHTITIDGDARPMFVRFCKAFNVSWTDTSLDLDKLVGLVGTAHVIIDTYEGRELNKIQYFA